MAYTLDQLNKIIAGEQVGTCDAVQFNMINTDSRTILPGQIFVALEGENFNGHDFIIEAQQKGAIAAIVSQTIKIDFPHIRVADTRKALGQLATFVRQQRTIPVLAITGSCGKTTTKAMLTSIMEQCGKVLSPPGSYNNDIGLPLTLLKLSDEHQYAVIELGANHFGEINYLTNIAKPTVATVLNVGSAHLAGFGDEQGVAREKGTIFNGLDQSGIAVINLDDSFADYFKKLNKGHKTLFFSVKKQADLFATDINITTDGKVSFTLHIVSEKTAIKLPTLGQHNVANALAAAACAYAAGVRIDKIKLGLENMLPVAKRLISYPGKTIASSLMIHITLSLMQLPVPCKYWRTCPRKRFSFLVAWLN